MSALRALRGEAAETATLRRSGCQKSDCNAAGEGGEGEQGEVDQALDLSSGCWHESGRGSHANAAGIA